MPTPPEIIPPARTTIASAIDKYLEYVRVQRVSQHPVEGAVYCEICERVSNSTNFRCGVCGSEAILSLRLLIDGPPGGPRSGPAAAGCIMPVLQFQSATAA